MGKRRFTINIPGLVDGTEDYPVKVLSDDGALWFCLEDLNKHLGSWVDDACEKLDIPDEQIKHFRSNTRGGFNERLYICQSALYPVLTKTDFFDASVGGNIFINLLIAASEFCYGGPYGVAIHIQGLDKKTVDLGIPTSDETNQESEVK